MIKLAIIKSKIYQNNVKELYDYHKDNLDNLKQKKKNIKITMTDQHITMIIIMKL